jgi:predicted enzyme related to lactoylglutathione lyase
MEETAMNEAFKQHGAFSWCELMTPDPEKAKAFYATLLGWEMEDMPMESGTYTVLKAGDQMVGGIMKTPAEAQGAPPYWATYVTVRDVDATARKAKEMGANILVAPRDIPDVGRFAVFQDPQGAVLSVITYLKRD